MNKSVMRRRRLVILLTLTMILCCLRVGVWSDYSIITNAEEFATVTDSEVSVSAAGYNEGENFSYEDIYNSENFDVSFKLDNKWDTGYNATIAITNTSDSTIENWCLTFPLNETISDIWNATVSEEHEDFYVIKNAGWNQDIAVGGSVSFGITVYEPFTEFPDYYTIIGNQVETKSEDYTIDYKVTEDWGEGYKAEITITNNKTTAIEDWRLSFGYGDNRITQIWNAVILGNEEGKYELSCETYNQNIAPGASVAFGFMVEPGCSGNMMENITLKEYAITEVVEEGSDSGDKDEEYDNSDSEDLAIILGLVEDDTNVLMLEVVASFEYNICEFYGAKDGKDYVFLGTVDDYGCLEYVLDDEFSSMEVYAFCLGADGEEIESNHIYVESNDSSYVAVMPDTDNDGVEDCFEIYYGSNVDKADSDEDGVCDYAEICQCMLNPVKIDTDENGILDGDEDMDADGLSNLVELEKGTNPIYHDTDDDGLNDGDEVDIYSTDPVLPDTDGDTLNDGDEIALGLNPNMIDTDGDGILDNEEQIEQTYIHQVENEECVIDEISITLNGTGNMQSNTTVRSVMEEDVLCAGVVGLVGEPFEITSECEFDKATITFKLDMDKLGDDVIFDNLLFLWYDEDNGEFVELETHIDEGRGLVSVDTNHFSKYMIVDSKVWYATWDKEMKYFQSSISDYDAYYTVLMIESSPSMKLVDPIKYTVKCKDKTYYTEKDCYRMGLARNYIGDMRDNEKVCVCSFNSSIDKFTGFTDDKALLKQKLSIVNDTALMETSYTMSLVGVPFLFSNEVLTDDISEKKVCERVIMITLPYDDNRKMYYWEEREFLQEGIQLDVIVLGEGPISEGLVNLSNVTGGSVYVIEDLDNLSRLYYDIYYNKNIDTTDTDGDMLYDVIEREGIRLKNGQIIYTDPNDDDTDGDGLLDGEEIIPEMVFASTKISLNKSSYRYYFNWNSDPTNPDSDGDGIKDDVDNRPLDVGYYSEEAGKIVIGKLTIVASTYTIIGHTYLLYESYVNDSLWLGGLTGGYNIYQAEDGSLMYDVVEAGNVYLGKGDCITIAASSVASGNFGGAIFEGNIENGDLDSAGIYYNREVMEEINEYKESGEEQYINNFAFAREISEDELSDLIIYHNSYNYYNILGNNCNIIATGAWNYAFGDNQFDVTTFPKGLKQQIMKKAGVHTISLQELWGIR